MAPSPGVAALPCIARARSRAVVDERKTGGGREFLGASPATAGAPVAGVHALIWNCPRRAQILTRNKSWLTEMRVIKHAKTDCQMAG